MALSRMEHGEDHVTRKTEVKIALPGDSPGHWIRVTSYGRSLRNGANVFVEWFSEHW